MESALLILLFSVVLYSYTHDETAKIGLIALVLLPWARLDSLGFVALYLVAMLLKNRRRALLEGIVVAVSVTTMG